jgi:hypothetical protein
MQRRNPYRYASCVWRTTTSATGWGTCGFRLTDDDMENLAMSLPFLVTLWLGACGLNPCHTRATVSSSLPLSTHCRGLTTLETRFNTETLPGDMERLLDGGVGNDEVRSKLQTLSVGSSQLLVGREDIRTIAKGFKYIFPRLEEVSSFCERPEWEEANFQVISKRGGELFHAFSSFFCT